jgi:hypothetical protein
MRTLALVCAPGPAGPVALQRPWLVTRVSPVVGTVAELCCRCLAERLAACDYFGAYQMRSRPLGGRLGRGPTTLWAGRAWCAGGMQRAEPWEGGVQRGIRVGTGCMLLWRLKQGVNDKGGDTGAHTGGGVQGVKRVIDELGESEEAMLIVKRFCACRVCAVFAFFVRPTSR